MADNVTVKISGLEDLQANLHELDDAVQAKVVRAAVRAGAVEVQKEMVTLAPKDTGLLAEHFDIKTKKQRGVADAVSAFIGPNSKQVIHPQEGGKTKGLPRTALFISKLLEFGSARMSKKPFLTQAASTSRDRALNAIIDKLKAGLSKWLQ